MDIEIINKELDYYQKLVDIDGVEGLEIGDIIYITHLREKKRNIENKLSWDIIALPRFKMPNISVSYFQELFNYMYDYFYPIDNDNVSFIS